VSCEKGKRRGGKNPGMKQGNLFFRSMVGYLILYVCGHVGKGKGEGDSDKMGKRYSACVGT
jgi:hypothetical protein